MNRKTALALTGAISIAGAVTASPLALAASSTGPAVTVQVKTPTKTLVNTTVHGETGWITKGGTPKGKCSGDTAAGALDAATHGKWGGKYYSSVTPPGILVISILGVKPKSPHYWAFLVNGKTANTGVCGVKLHKGEKFLFKVK